MGRRLDNATALYLEAIRDGRYREAIERYAGERYTQHSTPVRDGREGFVEFFEGFVRRNPVRDIEVVRGFEDGRYVFLHVVQNLNDGEFRYVTADIFDTDDEGRLIEHWDIIGEMVEGRGQIDGPTEPTDLHRTEDNRELVSSFLGDVLVARRLDRMAEYVSSARYTQHNPDVEDGIEGLVGAAERLGERGITLSYRAVHRVVACGSFVAALSHVDRGAREMAVIDLFRIEDGLIVEHWDVAEEILPRERWVNSGKF